MSKQRRGRKPIGERALTSAEKMRIYRQRLRESGGKTFAIDITGERMSFVSAIASAADLPEFEILRQIMTEAIDWKISQFNAAAKLEEAGASNDVIARFYSAHQLNVMDYQQYLEMEFLNESDNKI